MQAKRRGVEVVRGGFCIIVTKVKPAVWQLQRNRHLFSSPLRIPPGSGKAESQSASATKETSLSGFRTKSTTKQPITFFVTVLRTERGDVRVLNRKVGKITFHRSLNYRELAPGQEYSVTIPVCLDEVDLEGWKQCSCELETRYYNQQGKDCFLGMLRATAKLALQ